MLHVCLIKKRRSSIHLTLPHTSYRFHKYRAGGWQLSHKRTLRTNVGRKLSSSDHEIRVRTKQRCWVEWWEGRMSSAIADAKREWRNKTVRFVWKITVKVDVHEVITATYCETCMQKNCAINNLEQCDKTFCWLILQCNKNCWNCC